MCGGLGLYVCEEGNLERLGAERGHRRYEHGSERLEVFCNNVWGWNKKFSCRPKFWMDIKDKGALKQNGGEGGSLKTVKLERSEDNSIIEIKTPS